MKHIISIDQSTSATKAFLMDSAGAVVRTANLSHAQSYPSPGRAEHDAQEIYENVQTLIKRVSEGLPVSDIAALAIANQRETTVLWDSKTGKPLCPAIVWQDVRAANWCEKRIEGAQFIRERTGLELSPYYSAAKAAHALSENPHLISPNLRIGTIDSYLLYRLTGGAIFSTDVSNASRTQLMNLHTLEWDSELCTFFGIPIESLPAICPSDADFGAANGFRIRAVVGDSHAALFGHGCILPGSAKATYGTGSSVMVNVGESPLLPRGKLSSSVGFAQNGETCYVLEGNVISSGDTLIWLRDNLHLVSDLTETERLASSVPDAAGVSLVPAFSGLGAPHYIEHARAMICGINRSTELGHIMYAALESIAHQNTDILEAIAAETGNPVGILGVDGGPTANRLLMQIQANLSGVIVSRSAAPDLSAVGAGYMAGIACGLYPPLSDLIASAGQGETFEPDMSEKARLMSRNEWKDAVVRAIAQY
ncbi:glycerol kinase 2 [Clostridia bacterium]|nr:glycerol kinase 2 [Clostridia bacterium]